MENLDLNPSFSTSRGMSLYKHLSLVKNVVKFFARKNDKGILEERVLCESEPPPPPLLYLVTYLDNESK